MAVTNVEIMKIHINGLSGLYWVISPANDGYSGYMADDHNVVPTPELGAIKRRTKAKIEAVCQEKGWKIVKVSHPHGDSE